MESFTLEPFSFIKTVWQSVPAGHSSVVEGEHGGDGGEPDAGDEEGVPDLGLVVALQGEGFAYCGLSVNK